MFSLTQRSEQRFDIAAEKALLGNIIIFKGTIERVAESGLSISNFYLEKHRIVFEILLSMYEEGVSIDSITLANSLKRKGLLDRIGGLDYILSLEDSSIGKGLIPEYTRIIIEGSTLRKIIEIANQTIEEAFEGNTRPEKICDQAAEQFSSLSREYHSISTKLHKMKEVYRNDR